MADMNSDKTTTAKTRARKLPAVPSDSKLQNSSRVEGAHSTKVEMFDAFNRSMAIIEFNVDGTILWANSNFLQTVGYSIDEIRGRHHSLFVDPIYRSSPEYREFWYELGQGVAKVARFKRIGKSGREIYLQAAYSPILDETGSTVKIVTCSGCDRRCVAGTAIRRT